MKLPTMISGNFEPHFSLNNMLKDAKYAQQLAKEKKIVTPVLDASTKAMEKAARTPKENGLLDYSAVALNFKTPPADVRA